MHHKILYTNISYEYRCQNPQQHIRKSNSTAYEQNYSPWPSGIYPNNARVVQHKINQLKIEKTFWNNSWAREENKADFIRQYVEQQWRE